MFNSYWSAPWPGIWPSNVPVTQLQTELDYTGKLSAKSHCKPMEVLAHFAKCLSTRLVLYIWHAFTPPRQKIPYMQLLIITSVDCPVSWCLETSLLIFFRILCHYVWEKMHISTADITSTLLVIKRHMMKKNFSSPGKSSSSKHKLLPCRSGGLLLFHTVLDSNPRWLCIEKAVIDGWMDSVFFLYPDFNISWKSNFSSTCVCTYIWY